MAENRIIRAAFGQDCKLGGLYNARNDKILSSSIFQDDVELSAEAVETILNEPAESKMWQQTETDSLPEKLSSLGISADFGANLLTGSSQITGSGSYLTQVKTSSRALQASAILTINTQHEALVLNEEALSSSLDTDSLPLDSDDAPEATHVIVGIQWGTRSVATVRTKTPQASATPKADGDGESVDKLQALQQILKDIGQLHVGTEEVTALSDTIKSLATLFEFKVSSDVPVPGVKAIDYTGVTKFVEKLPSAVAKANSSKGECIAIELMPINDFLNELNQEGSESVATVTEVDDNVLTEIIDAFQGLNDVKGRLNDYLTDIQAHAHCVPADYILKTKRLIADTKYEKELKSTLLDSLSNIRNGNEDISELRQTVSKYFKGKGSLAARASIMDAYTKKMAFIDQAVKDGAKLVPGISLKSLEELENDHSEKSGNLYVLYLTGASTSSQSWEANEHRFRELLQDEAVTVAIFDCDMAKPTTKVMLPSIQMRRRGKVIIPDVVVDAHDLADKCLLRARAAQSFLLNQKVVPLEKRRLVKVACGSFKCSPDEKSEWLCPTCKDQVTFGYLDNNLYCSCGHYDISDAVFKCNKPTHGGDDFVPYSRAKTDAENRSQLRSILRALKPFPEYNILILGETGVGKSTFINAFVNYLLYDSLQDALDAENFTFAIPGYFEFPDKTIQGRMHKVAFGSENETEVMSTGGQSATQSTVTYVININGKLIRLIDTPGLGDTRGIDQDFKNVSDIVKTLESIDTLSTILFLLKPNNPRLTPSFGFVLSELMTHLHQDTAKNIVFGFTSARGSNFTAGLTQVPLEQLLATKNLAVKKLTDKNAFYFDSESFRFLAAKQMLNVEMDEKAMNVESWNKSAEEARRLVNLTLTLEVHEVKKTLSLNRTRRLIGSMSQNLVTLSQTIKATQDLITAKITHVERLKREGLDLASQLTYTKVVMKKVKLEFPRTVCCDPSCSKHEIDPATSIAKLVFVKFCHEHCYITSPEDTYGAQELGQCASFPKAGADCLECRHEFAKHCHVTYDIVFNNVVVENEKARESKKTKDDQTAKAERWIAESNQTIAEMGDEDTQVKAALAQFNLYLRHNAIAAFNDSTSSYLSYLIQAVRGEELPKDKDGRVNEEARVAQQKKILEYESQKKAYDFECEKAKESIDDKSATIPDEKDINRIIGDLGDMHHYGSIFKGLLVGQTVETPPHRSIPVQVGGKGTLKRWGEWMIGGRSRS
ncbi:hypothetical protein ACLX1H_011253 [Fusarium chlamydosporum]